MTASSFFKISIIIQRLTRGKGLEGIDVPLFLLDSQVSVIGHYEKCN